MQSPSLSTGRFGRLEPATTLAELSQTLLPEPLETPEEIAAFYRDSIQRVRGIDRIGEIRLRLEDAFRDRRPFKGFLLGHSGVGKTTEMVRLLLGMQNRFLPLPLSVTSELNPGTLKFYDVLLLMLLRLVREVQQPKVLGFAETEVNALMERVRDHLSRRWTEYLRTNATEFGGGLDFPFVKLFGNIKQGRTRVEHTEDYQVSFVSELVELMNDVTVECNRLLAKHQNGRQWLIVVEDFEKIGLDPALLRELFIGLRPSLQGLDAHILMTIPLWLHYSEDTGIVLPPNFAAFLLPDIAVYQEDHTPDGGVIAALKAVVAARADAGLFEAGVLDLLCIASGGNLRDLFSMIQNAMVSARLRGGAAVGRSDAKGAVLSLRNDYKLRLGSTGYEENPITLEEKLTRLAGIHQRSDRMAEVPDRVLYLLLRQRFVLQYNGAMWMGVHPLVTDLLMEFKKLPEGSPGGSGV